MRIIQDTIKDESQIKQTTIHVQYNINTCRIWGIYYYNHNKIPLF